jgi:hypothetical protein
MTLKTNTYYYYQTDPTAKLIIYPSTYRPQVHSDSAISSAGVGRGRLDASPATVGDQLSRMQWTQPIREDICADR